MADIIKRNNPTTVKLLKNFIEDFVNILFCAFVICIILFLMFLPSLLFILGKTNFFDFVVGAILVKRVFCRND